MREPLRRETVKHRFLIQMFKICLSGKPSQLNLMSLFNCARFTTRTTCSEPHFLQKKALVKIWQKEPHLSGHSKTFPGDDASQALKKRPEIEPKFARGPTGEQGQVFTVKISTIHLRYKPLGQGPEPARLLYKLIK